MRTWYVTAHDEYGQPFGELVYAQDRADARAEFALFGYPIVAIDSVELA
jgi:hypothetical protein